MTMEESHDVEIKLLENLPGEDALEVTRKALAEYGVKKLSEVPPEKLKDLVSRVSCILMAKTANRNAAPKK